jgi:hypothetical protein
MVNAAIRLHNPKDTTAERDAITELSQVFEHPDELRKRTWGYLRHLVAEDPGVEEALRLLLAAAEEKQGGDPNDGTYPYVAAAELGWLLTVIEGWD